MKIQLASDLHLEFLERKFPGHRVVEHAGADVLVLAGDIHRGALAIEAFADWPVPVVYVHGNHEPFDEDYDTLLAQMRTAASGTQVHFLENDELLLHGTRFLGCCLWTDYQLGPATRAEAMAMADEELEDHRLIRLGQGRFVPAEALARHQASRAWLARRLATTHAGPTVVVSHHAPHPDSIEPRFAGSSLNPAFTSDLTPLLAGADLWLHGHMHAGVDYVVGATRVLANPRGYPLNLHDAAVAEALQWENPRFDARLVVELT